MQSRFEILLFYFIFSYGLVHVKSFLVKSPVSSFKNIKKCLSTAANGERKIVSQIHLSLNSRQAVNGYQKQTDNTDSHISTDDSNSINPYKSKSTYLSKFIQGKFEESWSTKQEIGAIFNPDEIIYPCFDSSDSGVSLVAAISKINHALSILSNEQHVFSENKLLRIQQKLKYEEGDISPLQWLKLCGLKKGPKIYFTDSLHQYEVAGFSSSLDQGLVLQGDSILNDVDWGVINRLPSSVRLIGGGRFDPFLPLHKRDKEWLEFGGYFYILPQVELSFMEGEYYLSVNLYGTNLKDMSTSILDNLSPFISTQASKPQYENISPILKRNEDNISEEKWEQAIEQSLSDPKIEKSVLSRKLDLYLSEVNPLDLVIRMKYFTGHVGNFFFLSISEKAFWGCTPEKLFSIGDGKLKSEALAGTRTRGFNEESDSDLTAELLYGSKKDMSENEITKTYISKIFEALEQQGQITLNRSSDNNYQKPFVRRLKQLQHICQYIEGSLSIDSDVLGIARYLLEHLNPTPAICGYPKEPALDLIREYEGYDRGYYSGPFGYISRNSCDVYVAIRSALHQSPNQFSREIENNDKLSVFAGAGIVDGSTAQGEWTETSHKLNVISSLFPPTPFSLNQAPNANMAFALSLMEEIIRNGVTMFYICPGSRSTPLTTAISILQKKNHNLNIVKAKSTIDERGAGFRAVGYHRRTGRTACVITSSGTAVANLYPSIIEAEQDGLSLLIVTADRPYENRENGSNQAIDQIKIFSSHVKWFRDILPPSSDATVPISTILSDVNHAIHLSDKLRGPVHLNVQFRENLAPDPSRTIRGDSREGSEFQLQRYTSVPGFNRWANHGRPWQTRYLTSQQMNNVEDILQILEKSKRGIIVVGNLRTTGDSTVEDISDLIVDFANKIGFPIMSSILAGGYLRRHSISYAEHIMKSLDLQPDLILQIGAPLISTEIPGILKKGYEGGITHIVLHPHSSTERVDPDYTVTHVINQEISQTLKQLLCTSIGKGNGSEIASILKHASDILVTKMPQIIHEASQKVIKQYETKKIWEENVPTEEEISLTEPQIMLAISEVLSSEKQNLFLSNSMPVRDAEFFLHSKHLRQVAVNRGASGIDGIISSAIGFADCGDPTSLIIGDLACLHDLNGLHMLSPETRLTTVVVNNNGGGIFSFLPIANYKSQSNFEEFFGTPTQTFSYPQAALAAGLDEVKSCGSYSKFKEIYRDAITSNQPNFIEAKVVNREMNVKVHQEISQRVKVLLDKTLISDGNENDKILPYHVYCNGISNNPKTMVLLHGFMGSKEDWKDTVEYMFVNDDWKIIAFDLPGHFKHAHHSLNADCEEKYSLETMAKEVLDSLQKLGYSKIDALAGYSLGGRIALTMKQISRDLIDCKLILLSTNVPQGHVDNGIQRFELENQRRKRLQSDLDISKKIMKCANQLDGSNDGYKEFLLQWYSAPIWGENLQFSQNFKEMLNKKLDLLKTNGWELAKVLIGCSPSLSTSEDIQIDSSCLYIAGSLDTKYSKMGRSFNNVEYCQVENVGHALLVESPKETAAAMTKYLSSNTVSFNDLEVSTEEKTHITEQLEFQSQEVLLKQYPDLLLTVAQLDIEYFELDLISPSTNEENKSIKSDDSKGRKRKKNGLFGIGWGDAAFSGTNGKDETYREKGVLKKRSGYIIQITASENYGDEEEIIGIGEVSPLPGFHTETLEEVRQQLQILQKIFSSSATRIAFNPHSVLSMNGSLTEYLSSIGQELYPSVRVGLEMAILSISSQAVNETIPQAILLYSPYYDSSKKISSVPVNSLVTRGSSASSESISFPSTKVKVGGKRDIDDDVDSILEALESSKARGDANRAWNKSDADLFVNKLKQRIKYDQTIEFIEEPLAKSNDSYSHIDTLESWYHETGNVVKYALDETLADLVLDGGSDGLLLIEQMLVSRKLEGCAAFVLKPSLLGLETSFRIAMLLRNTDIDAVLSSTFESGVGLSHYAFLSAASDAISGGKYSHGLGTFEYLEGDTIIPNFYSYMDKKDGTLDVFSLGEAIYELGGLEQMKKNEKQQKLELLLQQYDTWSIFSSSSSSSTNFDENATERSESFSSVPQDSNDDSAGGAKKDSMGATPNNNQYRITSSTRSKGGKELNLEVSLPLPFSDNIACSRFTDLPQQSRWSPWLSSVEYLPNGDGETTEWTLKVRGIQLRWRAKSALLPGIQKGITWESVQGVQNMGRVEFIPTSANTCVVTVQMKLIPPRILSSTLLFGSYERIETFLQNKLLKWSLEMFRDVVKADLALERGDVELGDALFGAVEGRANAIQATLSPDTDDNTT